MLAAVSRLPASRHDGSGRRHRRTSIGNASSLEIAAPIVAPRYSRMSAATIRLPEAIASPTPSPTTRRTRWVGEVAIRAGRGHFARLVQVPGCPDAQQLANGGDRGADRQCAPGRLRQPQHQNGERQIRAARARRARRRVRSTTRTTRRRQPSVHGFKHVPHVDIEETHARSRRHSANGDTRTLRATPTRHPPRADRYVPDASRTVDAY